MSPDCVAPGAIDGTWSHTVPATTHSCEFLYAHRRDRYATANSQSIVVVAPERTVKVGPEPHISL